MKQTVKKWNVFKDRVKKIKEHYVSCNPLLMSAINDFYLGICKDIYAFGNVNTSKTIWTHKSLLPFFCESLDEVLVEIHASYPVEIKDILADHSISFPLRNLLKKKNDCVQLSDQIIICLSDIENILDNFNDIDVGLFSELGEHLRVISELLLAMFKLNNNPTIKWCAFCFRRAVSKSKYCIVHQLDTEFDDTEYRIGARLHKSLSEDIKKKWARDRKKRILLGEDVKLIYREEQWPPEIYSDTSIVKVIEQIYYSNQNTQTKPWNVVCYEWDLILDSFPTVQFVLGFKASNWSNWNEFRFEVQKSLFNYYEMTVHPYWFYLSIGEAEDWLIHKKINEDKRTNLTKSEVLKLSHLGLTNKQIALKLGKSYSQVCYILKNNRPVI